MNFQKNILYLLLFFILILFTFSCRSKEEKYIVYIQNENFQPIDNARISVNKRIYFSDRNGKILVDTKILKDQSNDLEITRENYQQISIKVPALAFKSENVFVLTASDDSYNSNKIALTPPELLTPTADREIADNNEFEFRWGKLDYAVNYYIQVSADSQFNSLTIIDTLSPTTYKPSEKLQAGNYYWRVSAVTADNRISGWSETKSFTIKTKPKGIKRVALSVPSLLNPEGGAKFSSNAGVISFDWTELKNTDDYEIQFASDKDFSDAVRTAETPKNSYNSSVYLAPGKYYWRVRAKTSTNNRSWSNIKMFEITKPDFSLDQKYLAEAEVFEDNEDWDNAIASYKKISSANKELYNGAQTRIAFINQNYLKNVDESIEDYTTLIKEDATKNDAEVYLNRGLAYFEKANFPAAAKDFDNAIAYQQFFTGSPSEKRDKIDNLYYYRADAVIRMANLEENENRQQDLYEEAILKMQDYLDKFRGSKSRKYKYIESISKRFQKKLVSASN